MGNEEIEMRRLRKSERGLSLVELIVSIPLVTVALVGTVAALTVGAELSRATQETRDATRANAVIMEQIRSTPFENLTALNGEKIAIRELVPEATDGTVSIVMDQVENGSAKWLVYRIVVTAEWNAKNGSRSMQFATYMSDRTHASASLAGSGYVLPDTTTQTTETTTTSGY